MKPPHLGRFEARMIFLECSFACKAQTMFQFKCTSSLKFLWGRQVSHKHSVEGKSGQLLERAQPK